MDDIRIIEFIQAKKSPMGWPNAFYEDYFNAESDELSLIFGLFFLYLYLVTSNIKIYSVLILNNMVCIFFHALYGLAIFFLAMV